MLHDASILSCHLEGRNWSSGAHPLGCTGSLWVHKQAVSESDSLHLPGKEVVVWVYYGLVCPLVQVPEPRQWLETISLLVGSPFWFMVQFANVTAVLVYVRDDLKKCGSILYKCTSQTLLSSWGSTGRALSSGGLHCCDRLWGRSMSGCGTCSACGKNADYFLSSLLLLKCIFQVI